MRILDFVSGLVIAHSNDPTEVTFNGIEATFNSVDDPLGEIHGDIRYTSCQANLLRRNGIEISDSNVENDIDDDEYCDQKIDAFENHRGALDNSVRYWKDNFNEKTNRFRIPYMFDGSHSAEQMDTIRRKLAEFRQETCVDLFEIPWEDTYIGPFQEKYDNVFWVSDNVTCKRPCNSHIIN